jgi:sugar O-acyltransferase (sialic acid O-acetyltransferase NeuD family)
MEKPVIIFGAKGIAISALEIFESNGVVVYGFLDDDASIHNTEIDNVPVLGDPDDHGFLKLIGQKCEAFVAFDDVKMRENRVDYLIETRKVMPVNAIHQRAYITPSAILGHGNFINNGAVIGAKASIGSHCMIHSGAILDQQVSLDDFVQVGAGAVLNNGVKVGEHAFIGSGVIIVAGVTIGAKARIGAGSVVIKDVGRGETVFGNPAEKIK